MTLLELTVVIAVLLSLTSVLMLGARAWKSGSDRSGCLLTLRNTQMAVRSYQNMYGYYAGGTPHAQNGTRDIATHLFTMGYIASGQYSFIRGEAPCAGGGHYERTHPEVFPPVGQLYMACSLAATKHHELPGNIEW